MSTDPGVNGERLRRLRPEELDAAQAAVYDHIAGGPRAVGPRLFQMLDPHGGLFGPFNVMLLSPGVGDPLQALGAGVRYGSSLSDRVREMAILAVATHWDSAFERYAHEAVGRASGLSEEEVLGLRDPSGPGPSDPVEAASLGLVRALLDEGDVGDEQFARVREQLSESEVFELTTLVGYYATLALLMRVFRAGVEDIDDPSVDS